MRTERVSFQQFHGIWLSFFLKEVIKVKVKEVGNSGSQRLIINKNVSSVQRTG